MHIAGQYSHYVWVRFCRCSACLPVCAADIQLPESGIGRGMTLTAAPPLLVFTTGRKENTADPACKAELTQMPNVPNVANV